MHNPTLASADGVLGGISAHLASVRSTGEYGLVAQRLSDPKTPFTLCDSCACN